MSKVEEEDPILGPAGLVFRTPVRAKRRRTGDHSGAGGRHAKVINQISRIVRRRPEVMVKGPAAPVGSGVSRNTWPTSPVMASLTASAKTEK